jgi:hypothetical protein
MAHEGITPQTDQQLKDLITPFAENLSTVATALDISAAAVTRLENDKKIVDWINDVALISKQEKEQITKYRDSLFWGAENVTLQPVTVTVPPVAPATVESGIVKRVMGLIKTIKAHKNYNESIGELLGIIGPEKVVDFTNVKAILKLKHTNPEGLEFSFQKMGADGAVVSSYIYDASTPLPADYDDVPWEVVARLNHSPYVDKRLNKVHKPETRLYKIRLMKNDKLVGIESDVIHVAAAVYIDESGAELATKIK